jgi:5-formyltetrahydrofolate cyclo-ligase
VPATEPHPKSAIRASARETRACAFERFGERIGPILTANFLAQFSHPPRVDIAGYWPTNEEADIRPLMTALDQRGHRVGLPRVMGRGAPLRFLRWHPGDRLEAGFGGILEPAAGNEEIHPEVLLVPLLGFDATGSRLGYGGGFYDRTLAALRLARDIEAIGVAYSDQEVDSLPAGDHDERLDWVVTELGCRRFGQTP